MNDDHITVQRLLLLAAVSVTNGGLDNYVVARLERYGYTRQQVENAALRLLMKASDISAEQAAQERAA